MQKWHFDAWLTDINNGKDQLFHIHSASMNDADQGNTYYDGTQVGTVNEPLTTPITRPNNYNSAVGEPTPNTRSAKWLNSLPSTGFEQCRPQAIEGYLAHKWAAPPDCLMGTQQGTWVA